MINKDHIFGPLLSSKVVIKGANNFMNVQDDYVNIKEKMIIDIKY